jgi:hypothetical protein
MPDAWETANGLNPNSSADGNAFTLSTEGYTNLEVYLNSLVNSITVGQNAEGTISSGISEHKLPTDPVRVYCSNGNWNIQSEAPIKKLEVFNLYGMRIISKDLHGETSWSGTTERLMPELYLIKCEMENGQRSVIMVLLKN